MRVGEKRPLWVRCSSCNHSWAAAYVPCECKIFAELLLNTKLCPHCGSREIMIPHQCDGVVGSAN